MLDYQTNSYRNTRKAVHLRKLQGVLASPQSNGGKILDPAAVEKVIVIYENDIEPTKTITILRYFTFAYLI